MRRPLITNARFFQKHLFPVVLSRVMLLDGRKRIPHWQVTAYIVMLLIKNQWMMVLQYSILHVNFQRCLISQHFYISVGVGV